MIPRFTSPPASLKMFVLALTPTARTRTSKSTDAPLFILAVFISKLSAVSPSINFIPCSSRCFCMIAAHSSSKILESILSDKSHTVIFATFSKIPSAHLSPIRPAPIISTFDSFVIAFSSASVSSIVINENLFCTVSSPAKDGMNGEEPDAIHKESYFIFVASSKVTLLPSLSIFTACFP